MYKIGIKEAILLLPIKESQCRDGLEIYLHVIFDIPEKQMQCIRHRRNSDYPNSDYLQ